MSLSVPSCSLDCIVLYCIVLCCVVLCCAVSYRFVSYIIVFICIAQCVFKFDAFLNDHHSNVKLFYLTVLGYSHKGCFKDGRTRALPEHLSNFPQSELIVKCYQAAKAKGYKAFGCQYRTQCFSGPDAHNSYNKLGEATNCQDGTGGVWANDIYFIIWTTVFQGWVSSLPILSIEAKHSRTFRKDSNRRRFHYCTFSGY